MSSFREIGKLSTTEPRSVLMIAPTSFFADYGCHVRIREEAEALQQRGHSVTIATYHSGGPVPGLDIRRSLAVPGRSSFEVGSSRHKVAFDALLGARILGLLTQRRFDIIHGHLHEGALMGRVLGRLFGVPTVFDFQGSMTGEMLDHGFLRKNSKLYRQLLRLERWIDRSAPRILTSSANARRLLLDEFGCDASAVVVLPDAVNSDKFQPAGCYDPDELTRLRTAVGIPVGRKVVAYLGLLAEYQGTGLLLDAMARLLARRADVHLLLMGFPNVERYRQHAESLGIAGYVTFTGRVPYDEAPRMLALGDVAVSPKLSLTEGAGKLLNYMAVGLPVVSFDTPVAREYLAEHGLYAPPGDVAAFANELYAALYEDSNGRARECGRRLRQRAVQHYRWEKAAEEIEQVYAALRAAPERARSLATSPRSLPWNAKQDPAPISSTRRER